VGAVTINYGPFINTVISFLIVANAVFVQIRGLNNMRKQKEAEPESSNEEKLLGETRDLLKQR
jgi:large conductance mechanosensitive channel